MTTSKGSGFLLCSLDAGGMDLIESATSEAPSQALMGI